MEKQEFQFEEIKGGSNKEAEFVNFKTEGQIVEGFLDYKLFQKSKKEDFEDNYCYFLDDKSFEKRIAFSGTGQLNYKMKDVIIGDRVRITYLGTQEVKGFSKPLHNFKVEVAKKK